MQTKNLDNSPKTTPLLIILLILVSFASGALFMQVRSLKKQAGTGQGQPQAANSQVSNFNPAKTAKPNIKFFVMSFCPYGNQAEDGLAPVAKLFGDKVSWEPVYIVSPYSQQDCIDNCAGSVYDEARCQQIVNSGKYPNVPDLATCKKYFPYNTKEACVAEKQCSTIPEGKYNSLHGEQELNQDVRELCAWKMGDQTKWWDFVTKVNKSCTAQNADTCWEAQAQSAGLDTAKIRSCSQNEAKSLLSQQTTLVNKYQAQGSPTIIINETVYNGGRQPEDYKKALCSAFEKAPKECEQVLSATTAAPAPGSCN